MVANGSPITVELHHRDVLAWIEEYLQHADPDAFVRICQGQAPTVSSHVKQLQWLCMGGQFEQLTDTIQRLLKHHPDQCNAAVLLIAKQQLRELVLSRPEAHMRVLFETSPELYNSLVARATAKLVKQCVVLQPGLTESHVLRWLQQQLDAPLSTASSRAAVLNQLLAELDPLLQLSDMASVASQPTDQTTLAALLAKALAFDHLEAGVAVPVMVFETEPSVHASMAFFQTTSSAHDQNDVPADTIEPAHPETPIQQPQPTSVQVAASTAHVPSTPQVDHPAPAVDQTSSRPSTAGSQRWRHPLPSC
jgi:uncharacterized protein (DUF2132 family)